MIKTKLRRASRDGQTGLPRAALALVPPLGALVVQLTFWPYIEPFVWFLFYPAVFLSSRIDGRRGGLLATLVSTVLVWFFFLPTRYSFSMENPWHFLSVVMFMGMGVAFSLFHHRLRKASHSATQALAHATSVNDRLEARVAERTAELARSNDSFRAAEALLRVVTDNARVGLVLVSAEHRYLFSNAAYHEMLNLGDADIVGKRVADVLTNVYESQIRPRLDRAFAGERVSYELRAPPLPGTGTEHVYTVTYEPRTDAARVDHVVVVIYDITEVKQAEQAIAQSQQLLQAVADNSTAIIWVKSVEGRYLLIDGCYQEVFRADRTGIIGKTDYDLFSREEADAFRAVDQEALTSGTATQVEEVALLDDGPHTFLSVKCPLADETGKVYALCGISTDITERKLALEALRRADQQYHLLFDTMLHGSVYQDANGRVVSMNPAAERILGQTKAELLGRSSESVEHRTLREDGSPFPGTEHPSMVALHTGHTVEGTVMAVFNPREGAYRWISISAVPLFHEGADQPYQVYAVFEDITERKRAEEVHAKLAAVVESSDDAIIGKTLEGIVTSWNPGAGRVFGYTADEVVGGPITVLLPADRIGEEKEILERIGAGVTVRHFETVRKCKDGRLVDVSVSISPIRDAAGRIIGASKIARDITERKRADRELHDSEQKLRLFIEHAPAAIAMFDRDMRYLAASRRWVTDYELSERDIVGRSHYEIFPEIPQEWKAIHQRCLGGATERRDEEPFQRLDGRTIWVRWEVLPWREQGGAVGGIIIATEDVTPRKRAEAALSDSEAKYRTLLESMSDGVFVAQDFRFVFANPALPLMLGYAEHELVGMPFDRIVGPEFLEVWTQRFSQRVTDGLEPARHYELRFLRKDGEAIWVELRAGRVSFEGKPAVLGIIRDITDRRRAEESLRRAQKLEALGTLAGGIAHDFNNLLLAITGNAKLATEEIGVDSPAQESIAEIGKAGARAADLVKRILAFSRPEDSQPQVVQLQPILEEALKLLRSTLPAMIEIKRHFAPDIPRVIADPSQIHQVAMNLVTNAAHAIGGVVGRIEVGLDAVTVGADLAQATPDLHEGRYVRVTVSDSGCGMDTATLQRIFDPFFTTKPAGEGTGLGLSVVHGIMRSHHGAINVYSQPGKGTTFRLYFPASGEFDVVDIEPTVSVARRGRGERVLYVDDEGPLVLLATRMLQRLGYEVAGYTEPSRALELFEAHPQAFDILITDLSMPVLSGFDLARRVRAVRPDIPIVMTSGYVRPEDQKTAQSIGVQELILKPDTIDALGEVLNRLLHIR